MKSSLITSKMWESNGGNPCDCLSPVGDALGVPDPECTRCNGTGSIGG